MRNTAPKWRTRWTASPCGGWSAMRVPADEPDREMSLQELRDRVAAIYAGRGHEGGKGQ